jgi:hypothetical protein
MTLRRLSLAVIFLIGSAVAPAFAQEPTQTKINFTTSSSFELKGSDVVLPAGNYMLYQVDPRDRQLFALYHESMRHSPVAMIRTVRIQHDLGQLPRKTMMLMDIDGRSSENLAVLEGWNVPGDYGYEVIAVTPSRHLLTSRLQVRR